MSDTQSEVLDALAPEFYEEPPTTPVEPPAPAPEPDDPVPAEDTPPAKTAEDLLAEIAEDERRLSIIDRNIEQQRLELARKKNQLAALHCPIKPGDTVRIDRSRFKMANVLAIVAPSGTQHKNGIKSFSMTTQGIKQDGTLSDVIWTSHDYQLLEKIVFADPVPPITPPEEPPIDPLDKFVSAIFAGLVSVATPDAFTALEGLLSFANEKITVEGFEQSVLGGSQYIGPDGEVFFYSVPVIHALSCLEAATQDAVYVEHLSGLMENASIFFTSETFNVVSSVPAP